TRLRTASTSPCGTRFAPSLASDARYWYRPPACSTDSGLAEYGAATRAWACATRAAGIPVEAGSTAWRSAGEVAEPAHGPAIIWPSPAAGTTWPVDSDSGCCSGIDMTAPP